MLSSLLNGHNSTVRGGRQSPGSSRKLGTWIKMGQVLCLWSFASFYVPSPYTFPPLHLYFKDSNLKNNGNASSVGLLYTPVLFPLQAGQLTVKTNCEIIKYEISWWGWDRGIKKKKTKGRTSIWVNRWEETVVGYLRWEETVVGLKFCDGFLVFSIKKYWF